MRQENLLIDLKRMLCGKGKTCYLVDDIKEAFNCIVTNQYEVRIQKVNDCMYKANIGHGEWKMTFVFEVILLENDWYEFKNVYIEG